MPLFSDEYFQKREHTPAAEPSNAPASSHLELSQLDLYKEDLFVHKCKDGRLIPLTELSDSHLANIINLLSRKAENGIKVGSGGGHDPDEFWYKEECYTGLEAASYLRLNLYWREAARRFCESHRTNATAAYTPIPALATLFGNNN